MDNLKSPIGEHVQSVPDHAGENYTTVLERLHRELRPQTYMEIGTATGQSLYFVDCPSIAIDPEFAVSTNVVRNKSLCAFFQMSSDRYFAKYDPKVLLGGPIEMAFLDGMHRCEFLLRDFINTERHCKRNSIVFMHDCVPVELSIVDRIDQAQTIEPHRQGWWLGDVWRTLLALKRRRPDLRITVVDAPPSGLVCITNLDPGSTTLHDNYQDIVEEMFTWSLEEIGLTNFFGMIDLQSTACIDTYEKITQRFWL